MNTKTLIAILAASVVGVVSLENLGPKYQFCEVYRGYRENDSDVSITYVFDPEIERYRTGSPRLAIGGNANLKGRLNRGTGYCGTYIDPLAFWSQKKLVEKSLREDNSSSK